MRSGPLSKSYSAAVALVVLALIPFLMLTSAVLPLAKVIARSVGLSQRGFDLTVAMSDAAYAFATVLAVQFAQHLRQRRMLVVYATGFVVASVLAAWAPDGQVFVAGFVVQGLCTSLMLIAAVPPLVTGWPAKRMPVTAMVMNLCIFGAVAVGPTLGSLQASAHAWRPLFWVVAGLSLLALAFVGLTFDDDDPADLDAPWDLLAVLLAAGGCAAAFFGAGYLQGHLHLSALSLVPLIAGFVAVVGLVMHQYYVRQPLMPVKQLATTFPVAGIVIAMFTSAAAFGLMQLLLTALQTSKSPRQIALIFLPEFVAAVVTAVLFALVFRTRLIPVLAFSGIALLVVAAVLADRFVVHGSVPAAYASTALIGLGVGASVSPALFLAGFSLRSSQIQRVFALIELLRGVTAFLAGPILAYVVTQIGGSTKQGTADGVWICLGLAAAGEVLALATFGLGRGRLQAPDLERWQEEGERAWESPPLFDRVRRTASGVG